MHRLETDAIVLVCSTLCVCLWLIVSGAAAESSLWFLAPWTADSTPWPHWPEWRGVRFVAASQKESRIKNDLINTKEGKEKWKLDSFLSFKQMFKSLEIKMPFFFNWQVNYIHIYIELAYVILIFLKTFTCIHCAPVPCCPYTEWRAENWAGSVAPAAVVPWSF